MLMDSLTGQLLLATPSLQDPNFAGSVVLICHHDADGSMGLIINRPQTITIGEVLTDLEFSMLPDSDPNSIQIQKDALTFEGGPVDPFRGFILHDGWHVYESTMQISPELHLTTSRDVLEDVGKGTGPEHFIMLLGYAGWGAEQLEEEITNNDWLVAPATQNLIFQTPPELRWTLGANSMGIDKSHLSSEIGHA